MKKHELLIPAGDMESLHQAVLNGADAVYLGCKSFGARKFARNFDNEEIIDAIKFAHLYGVKIYVTMNTLVKDEEVDDFLNQIEFLHKNGVDAVIVQDFGMICLIREMYPNLEVHASTQANTSSKETAELFYKLGVKRVVFSREMSLDEINEIDVPIEKEVFIHGALCICYSGCCLMSSMLGTRSGNRGECAGSCRLPYSLETNGSKIIKDKYLLSTKELNSSINMDKLLDSDIASFKVEGRMKSPEYVGFITRYYRNLIDRKNIDLEEETNKLKTIFNREFTSGNLFNTKAVELMNTKTPNHIGLEIGEVIEVTPKKIKIKLTAPLNQQDAIRFKNSGKGFIANYIYDKKDNLINSATDICYVDNKVNLTEKDIVCKTQDYQLLTELKKLPERKINISFEVNALVGEPLEISITDGNTKITEKGSIVQSAMNAPISSDRIKEQLEKLGNTPYISTSCKIAVSDAIFISIKELNDIRRTLIERLTTIRENNKVEFLKNDIEFKQLETSASKEKSAVVRTQEALDTCLALSFDRIYVDNKDLYSKYQNHSNIYYKIPRCTRCPSSLEQQRNLVSDYYDFTSKSNAYVSDYTLNVTNIYTVYYLHKNNVKTVNLSVELNANEITNLITKYQNKFKVNPNLELLVYGRIENMLIKGNILDINDKMYSHTIIDFKERKFPVYFDGTNTHILNYETNILDVKNIKDNNLSFRYDFYDESSDEIKKIVNTIC